MRSLAKLGVALTMAVVAASGAATSPAGIVRGGNDLPACRYDDILTEYTSYTAWRKTLVDTIYELPGSYMPPPGLTSTDAAGVAGDERVRRLVIDDLAEMAADAEAADLPLLVMSGYRSYKQQQYVYRREVRRFGLEQGRLQVARPGHSEHHLGTAIDFTSRDDPTPGWKFEDWATTPVGAWLKENAWKYGFVMSYTKGDQDITCYIYEPWHYRYVGRSMAADLRASGLTLREYLWYRFHTN